MYDFHHTSFFFFIFLVYVRSVLTAYFHQKHKDDDVSKVSACVGLGHLLTSGEKMDCEGRFRVLGIFLLVFYSLVGITCTNLVRKIKRDVDVSSYTHFEELKETLLNLEVAHPNVAKVGNIGKSVQGKEQMLVRLT